MNPAQTLLLAALLETERELRLDQNRLSRLALHERPRGSRRLSGMLQGRRLNPGLALRVRSS